MGQAVALRADYDGAELRAFAKSSRDAKQARRLLALSLIYDGADRTTAARHANVGLQTIRDWVLRFNADGAAGLIDGKSPGTPPRLNKKQKAALAQVVEEGPTPCIDGVVRWRLCDLADWVYKEFGIAVDQSTISRTLNDMGYAKLSARPRHHSQDPQAAEAFKKNSPPQWRKSKAHSRPARP